MSHFGELLLKARQRTRYTQKGLAEKVDLDDSYISRLERGVYRPPPRDVVLRFVDALGISDDEEQYLQFLAAAGVLSDEDLQDLKEFALVKVAGNQAVKLAATSRVPCQDIYGRRMPPKKEGEDGEAEDEAERESDALTYSIVNAAIGIPNSLFGSIGEQIKEIEQLVNSVSLTDEEEDMVASLLDTTKRLLQFIAAQHEMRQEE